MALIDITSNFQKNEEGKYQYELDSCTGVLQVERAKSPDDKGIEIYSYLPGMKPYRRMQSGQTNIQVDLEFHIGMKLLVVSSTQVTLAKLLKDE